MRILSTLVIGLAVAIFAVAQGKKPVFNPDRDAPGVMIVGGSIRGPDLAAGRPSKKQTAPNRDTQTEVSIKVKNAGDKAIAAIEWQLTLDAGIQQPAPIRYKFRYEGKPVRPGETRKLTDFVDQMIWPKYKVFLRITRVEFSDGTTWQRESGD